MYASNNCANDDVNKLWILSKYSRYNFEESTWNTLDSSTCISPITLTISPSCHLIINYEKEIQECINLWNCKDTCQAVFKGSSLLFSHKIKDYIGKFRVKFLSYNNKSAEENCLLCVNQLKNYLHIIKLDDATPSNTHQTCDITQSQIVIDPQQLQQQQPFAQVQQQQQQYQSFGVLSNNSASIISSTIPMDTNVATKRTDDVTSSLFLQNNQMAQILLKQNENSLPFVLQQDTDDIINDDQSLKEFITCCLLDTKFPQFVDKVDKMLTEIVNNELNSYKQ